MLNKRYTSVLVEKEVHDRLEKYKVKLINSRNSSKVSFSDAITQLLDECGKGC